MAAARPFDPSLKDESRAYELHITLGVMLFAITTTTTARIVTKYIYNLIFWWDDFFIVLGTLLNIAINGMEFRMAVTGFGRHLQYLDLAQVAETLKLAQIALCIAHVSEWSVKMSICFFLLTMIRGKHRGFHWFIWLLMLLTTLTTIVAILVFFLQTRPYPLAILWDPRVKGFGSPAATKAYVAMTYIRSAFGVFMDFFYALSPIYFLWSVKMNRRKKATILALTGCGLLITVVGLMTIAWANLFYQIHDVTWTSVPEVLCDIIERNLSVFVVNLPALWVLLIQLQKKYTSYAGTRRPRLSESRSSAHNAFPNKYRGYEHADSIADDDGASVRNGMGGGAAGRGYGNTFQVVADAGKHGRQEASREFSHDDDIPLRDLSQPMSSDRSESRLGMERKEGLEIRVETEFKVEEEHVPRREMGEVLGWAEPRLAATPSLEEGRRRRRCGW